VRQNKRWMILLAVVLICSVAQPVYASSNMFDKMGRGVGNLLFGWMELPFQMMKVTDDEGSFAGATLGMVKGVAYGIGRTVVGFYEMVTFPIPNHKAQALEDPYGPILHPDFINFRTKDKVYDHI